MWKLSYRGLESHLFWIPNLCRKFSGKHGNELRLVSGLGFRMPTIWKGMKKEKINEYEKLIVILLNFQMIRGLMVLNYLLIFKVYIVFSKCDPLLRFFNPWGGSYLWDSFSTQSVKITKNVSFFTFLHFCRSKSCSSWKKML